MSQRSERNVEAGELIAERYRIEAPIGRGAMGSVWRAAHVRLDAPVAIKFLNGAIAGDPVMLERFMREARAAAAVSSSHVVKIFDYGVDGGAPFIAMELLVGETLDARLARGPLRPPELDRIFGEIARAVGVAHALGVVHRDIKPANIFLAREGDHDVTKVLDFGIAKLIDPKLEAPAVTTTDTGILLGTPQYMSPEQARGRRIDHRADLWALAVLAFECLTERHPFESETLGDLVVQICTGAPLLPSAVAELPAAFDGWFLRGVSKDPEARFGSAAEMASDLHTLLAAEKLGAASRPRSEPTPRRLELVGTEVIPTTTANARREDPEATPSAEAAPSLNATAIAAEVLPRQRPTRRRQLIAALALSAPVLALVLMLPRRTAPPHEGTERAAATPLHTDALERPDGAGGSAAGAAAAVDDVAAAGAPASGALGGAASRLERPPEDAARAPVDVDVGRARPPAPGAATSSGRDLPNARTRPVRPPRRAPAASPARAAAQPAPISPAAVEVAPDPASVPPAAADPYADRL